MAFTAAKKFNTNAIMTAAVVGVLIHPNFIALPESGPVHFLGIPVTSATYSSTLIPSILTAWAMSYIDRGVDKITPAVTKNFLIMMITAFSI